MKVYFKEVQRFRAWWMSVLLIGLFMFWGYSMYNLHFLKVPFGNLNPGRFNFTQAVLPLIILLLVYANLRTEISNKGISFQFRPFQFKPRMIKWEEIEHIYVREWSLKEFWGWGIRYNFKMTAYTTMGKKGIQINLKNGKKILLGTQKPELVTEVLTKDLLRE
jgi:hypothetical protein